MLANMVIDPKVLCLRIDEAFKDTLYPGDEHIVFDNSGSHLECEKVKGILKGRHWRNVSFEVLEQLRSALFFMSPEGYRFYLPAFMIFSIVDFYRADVIPDEIIQSLTPPVAADIAGISARHEIPPELQPFSQDQWEAIVKTLVESERTGAWEQAFFARMSGFSKVQSAAIRQFLEYMREAYSSEFPNREPEIAIERHWFLFSV
jgi:uncharacterized protein DUF6714